MKKQNWKMTRVVAVLLAAFLLIALLPINASALQFSDVYPGLFSDEIFDAINYVSDNGWLVGTGNQKFSPNTNLTRGMFVAILYRYSGSSEKVAPTFTDVSPSTYYYYPVGWAEKHGVVSGTSPTEFSPNSVLTKEQILAIFYRYSKNVMNRSYNVSDFVQITQHPDYGQISSYAKEAFRWAKTYRVLQKLPDSAYLYPKAGCSRAYTSLYLANFDKNVTGFTLKDRFKFMNSGEKFPSTYYMGASTINKLNDCIDNYYPSIFGGKLHINADKKLVKSYPNTEWSGACSGMTLCVYFDKIGKIDFNKNFAGVNTMRDVGDPKDNLGDVAGTIHAYHLLQKLYAFKNVPSIYKVPNVAPDILMESIFNYYQEYGPTPLIYFYNDEEGEVGHEVILTNIIKSANGSEYTLYVIDPSKNNTPYIRKLSYNDLCVVYDGKILTRIGFYPQSAFPIFDEFDMDGPYNNGTLATQKITEEVEIEATEEDSFAEICVPCTPFRIENAEGEYLCYDGYEIDGNINILSMRKVIGEGEILDLILEVSVSDYFIYQNKSKRNTSFFAYTPNGFTSVSGAGITEVSFFASEEEIKLEVSGQEMIYSTWLSIAGMDNGDFLLKGKNENSFSLYSHDCLVESEGLSGVQSYGISENEGNITEMRTINFNQSDLLNFSNGGHLDE